MGYNKYTRIYPASARADQVRTKSQLYLTEREENQMRGGIRRDEIFEMQSSFYLLV